VEVDGYWGLNTVGVPSVSFSSAELWETHEEDRSGSLSGKREVVKLVEVV